MKRVTEVEGLAPAVGPYSLAVVDNALYTSGQIGLTAEGELVEGGVEAETHQVMDNLAKVLGAAGVGFSDVVKTTIYLTNISHFATVNEVYAGYFADDEYPARETVVAAALPLGAQVEISMIAVSF